MGLVRAWRRQIYGASLVAILIPAAIIVVLFAVTGGGPLHGLGALGQVFSGPAIPGGDQSEQVSANSKPALPGKGTVGAAALRGHSPVLGPPLTPAATTPHGNPVAPLHLSSTTPSSPSSGGSLHGGGGLSNNPNPAPPPPASTPTTTSTTSTTTTQTTTAASQPPIVAIPPTPTETSTTPTTTTTTTTTTPVHTTTTSTTTRTTTTTTTTHTTTTTRTTTTITRPVTTKTITKPFTTPTPNISTTAAQAEHGWATFTGCSGDWGVVDQPDRLQPDRVLR